MTDREILEAEDIIVDVDIQISDDGKKLEAYLETWFDVEKKFKIKLKENDWVNLYAILNPKTNHLKMIYFIDTPDTCTEHRYRLTHREKQIVINKITERIRQIYNCTPMEYLQ